MTSSRDGVPLLLDGQSLTCSHLIAAVTPDARPGRSVALTDAAWDAIRQGRKVVDGIVAEGQPAYGITTGVGSQKDFQVDAEALVEFNSRLITAHATRVPGPTLPDHRIRAAMIIIANQLSTGRSGVSEDLVRVVLDGIDQAELPVVDASGSVGASDLVPLAQIANWLFKTDLARHLGVPKPKDALSFINSNAVTLAAGADVLADADRLADLYDLVGAVSLEAFRGNLDAISEPANAVHRRSGQYTVAERMRRHLAGSALWQPSAARFLQDPLSFRCMTQVHGATRELLDRAMLIWDEELNSLSDNPVVDPDNGGVRSHGNMDTTRLTLAIDSLRQALAKTMDLAGERMNKQQWPAFSGLPVGLAETGSATGGVQFLCLAHIAASLITSAKIWAHPHLLTSVGQLSDGVEDTASYALHAVHDLERITETGWKIATIELAISVWAIRRRGLAAADLGEAVAAAYETIAPHLPIGTEGINQFDLDSLVRIVQSGELCQLN